MRAEGGAADALRPLWFVSSGAALGAAAAVALPPPTGPAGGWALALAGGIMLAAALLCHPRRGSVWLLLTAGLALMLGRGLAVRAGEGAAAALPADAAVRVEVRVTGGWWASRWGSRAAVRVVAARQADSPRRLPRHATLEVRGDHTRWQLPPPGATVETLAAVRTTDRGTLLIAASASMLRTLAPPHGPAAWRDSLAQQLLAAAGTDVRRIRAAELVAAVALGRRDLLPVERRDAWRRAGLAHVLAVSGLHVGLVGAMAWLAAVAAGLRPGPTRAVTALAVVGYAVLAGGSPSALRAAAMGVVVLAARSLGRAVLPLAAVLLAAVLVLATDPTLVADPGFQLTVVITAALVRWVPPLVESLPLPRVLAGGVAVPVVAQAAAAPLVMWHFRSAAAGAVLTNLAVPLLVTPTLAGALAATALAPLWSAAAARLLDLVGLAERLLWWCGGPARASFSVTPSVPLALAAVLVVSGWLGLQLGRRARPGVAVWLAATVAAWLGWPWAARPAGHGVALLEVSDGLGAVVWSPAAGLLFDGGRAPLEATRQLRDLGWRRLDTVLASHTDEDHVGGLATAVEVLRPRQLVVPAWLVREPAAADLLRAARRVGARVVPVARGSVAAAGDLRLDVLWPPVRGAPVEENERSLVVRARDAAGTVLLTADIGRGTEARLAAGSNLACDVLLVPHHGSRHSSSAALLDDARPAVALIPAGPFNLHHHPAPEVLARLAARGIPWCAPIRHGACGARASPTGWRLDPPVDASHVTDRRPGSGR